MPMEAEEHIGSPGTGDTEGYEPLYRCQELSPRLLEEPPVLLTAYHLSSPMDEVNIEQLLYRVFNEFLWTYGRRQISYMTETASARVSEDIPSSPPSSHALQFVFLFL